MDLYTWLVVGHVVAVILSFAAHGVSAYAMFRIGAERDRTRLGALLDLSGTALTGAGIGLLVAILLGIWASIVGGHFGRLWPWASIGVLVVVVGAMTPMAAIPMNRLRIALGIQRTKAGEPAPLPGSDADLATALAGIRPVAPAAIGIAGIALLTWLMRVKPF